MPVRWLIFLIFLFVGQAASAAPTAQEDCPGDYIWKEVSAENFVILYTSSQFSLAQEIDSQYLQVINKELAEYEQAFGTALVTPITIRLWISAY